MPMSFVNTPLYGIDLHIHEAYKCNPSSIAFNHAYYGLVT